MSNVSLKTFPLVGACLDSQETASDENTKGKIQFNALSLVIRNGWLSHCGAADLRAYVKTIGLLSKIDPSDKRNSWDRLCERARDIVLQESECMFNINNIISKCRANKLKC